VLFTDDGVLMAVNRDCLSKLEISKLILDISAIKTDDDRLELIVTSTYTYRSLNVCITEQKYPVVVE